MRRENNKTKLKILNIQRENIYFSEERKNKNNLRKINTLKKINCIKKKI